MLRLSNLFKLLYAISTEILFKSSDSSGLLLAGGDKSTQQNDIRTALKLAKEIRGEA